MRGIFGRCAPAFLSVLCIAAGSASAQDDELEDILGGFEDEDPTFEVDRNEGQQGGERNWDLSGSVEVSGSINYLEHDSDTGTDYTGLQRLRNRLNLQLDVQLHDEWDLRLEGWGFWDAAYLANGRGEYTDQVLDEYELDADVGEAWVQGPLVEDLELKAGRQIVIWGRSETLRVLDVLNPLDNREPGRVDLEDIRRTLAMLRADAYLGDWTFTGIAIPEIRFDLNPVVGSDFFPGRFDPPSEEPKDWVDSEFAGSATGIFSGWDVSFHGAWFWNDQARFERGPVPRLVHDRLWMVGSGGNYTLGGWLLKYEVAYFDGLGFFNAGGEKNRFDGSLGVEYYGFVDTTIVFEGLNRHLFDYEPAMRRSPDFVRENSQEFALRMTRNFMRERLELTLVGAWFGWDARDGSIVRVDLDYDLFDALEVGGGILLYQKGDLPPLSTWGRNDRLIFRVKWSF